MTFDKQRVLEEVQGILGRFELPGSSADLISAGAVERVIANSGQINIVSP